MKLFTVLLLFISPLIMLNNSILMAQGSATKINGIVTDAGTGEPLPGASVILIGTSFGAPTDINGDFQITNVPPGTYSVQFSYIGYKGYKAENVKVLPGETLVLSAHLTAESIQGETVVVTAQKAGQISAINQQLSSNSIKEIVAKDYIQEVPDVNAAESIGRLPGVSLERSGGEGNKIVIDGLAPKFNSVEIDGVKLTGVDLDRSVGLSPISDEMLEGIELSKSLTPDMDADALGGTVNLTLKEADPGLHFNAFAQGSYNDLRNDYGNYKFSARISDRFFDNNFGVIGNFGTEKTDRSSDNFAAAYGTYLGNVHELNSQWAQVSQVLDERYRPFGDIVLDYETPFMKLKMDNMISQQADENLNRNNFFGYNNSEFDFQIDRSKPVETIGSTSLSGLFSFMTTELNLGGAYSNTSLRNYDDYYGFRDQDLVSAFTPYKNIPSSVLLMAQPSDIINKYYVLSSPKTSDLWNNVMSVTNRKDETFTYDADWKIPYTITQDISGNIKVGGLFSKKDRSNSGVELQGPYYGGRGIQFVSSLQKNNVIPGLIYNGQAGILRADGIPGINWAVPNFNWGNIFNGRYNLGYSEDFDQLDAFSHSVYTYDPAFIIEDGVPTYQNEYSNDEKKTAAYIMTELRIGQNLMLLPGVRYEKFHSQYTSFFIQAESESPTGVSYANPVTAYNDNEYWFPSVNAKFNVNDWSDIRAAYFGSCTRPDYTFLSPGALVNESKTQMYLNNPYLKPAIDHNFDLMYSIHSNEVGLLSFDGFYKEIDGLITPLPSYEPQWFDAVKDAPADLIAELQAPRALYDPTLFKNPGISITPQANYSGFPINNPNKTYFRGFELNWETNFWYLPGLLSNLVFDVNYSQIWSTTWLPYLNIVTTYDTTQIIPKPINTPYYETRKAKMYDQPAYILNVRLGWDYKGFSTRISFRDQGQTVSNVDLVYSLLDTYAKAQYIVDWTMKQELYKNLSFFADVSNLNNYIDDSYDNLTYNNANYSFPTGSNFYGIVADFGLRYDF